MSKEPKPPFQLRYSPGIPELLRHLQCTIAISTYQAGKVILLSASADGRLVQLPRTFPKPMGIGMSKDGERLSIATRREVIVFQNSSELAHFYPKKPGTYDAMYLPRLVYLTNALDIHDLDWVGDDLVAVNTMFSCIMKLSNTHNFEVVWKPPFIDKLASEDRCHLNGMTIENDEIRFVTAFSDTNVARGWRKKIPNSGVVIDVRTNEIIARELPMPHSPKMIDGRLILLLSATGQIVEVDQESGSLTEIIRLHGFVRGLSRFGDYLFVGLSRLRKDSSSFGKVVFPHSDIKPGVAVVQLSSGKLIGQILYESSVDEIYDVRILLQKIRPNILNTINEEYQLAVSTPQRTYWARPEK